MIARSSLGECISSWLYEGSHILIGLESYFDGSYSGKGWREGRFISLAGHATEDDIWTSFDIEWRRILNDDRAHPKAPYLHMKEASALDGKVFTWRNGWNRKKVECLVTELLEYLQSLDKKRFHQFACSIDLDAYRKLCGEGFSIPDPVEICNGYCPESVLVWFVTSYPGVIGDAHYFFDQNEPFKPLFEDQWTKEKQKVLDLSPRCHYWQLIKTVTTADMRDKPALQAADLLAWASNRVLTAPAGAFAKHLEWIMKQIVPSSWIVFDEARFRQELSQSPPCWKLTHVAH